MQPFLFLKRLATKYLPPMPRSQMLARIILPTQNLGSGMFSIIFRDTLLMVQKLNKSFWRGVQEKVGMTFSGFFLTFLAGLLSNSNSSKSMCLVRSLLCLAGACFLRRWRADAKMGVLLNKKSLCLDISTTLSILGFLKDWFLFSIVELQLQYTSVPQSRSIIIYRMKKEEQLHGSSSRPVGIFFIPEKIVLPYVQKLKLQIAFYRGNKVCKTKPNKYIKKNADNSTTLQHQKLNFCTTIAYVQTTASFESKKIDVQLAFDADGKREELQARIDMKDILEFKPEFDKKNLVIAFNDHIRLFYKIQCKFSEGLPPLKNVLNVIHEETSKERKQEKSANKKSISFAPDAPAPKQDSNNQQVARKEKKAGTYASVPKQEGKEFQYSDKINPLSKTTNLRDAEGDTNSIQAERQKKINSLRLTIQNLEKKNQKLEARIKQFQQKYEIKQNQLTELESLNKQLIREKKELLGSKNDEKDMQKLLQKKNIQIRKLQDEIAKHLIKETEYYQKNQSLAKSEQTMREKYQQSQRKNVKLIQEMSEKTYQIDKLKKQLLNISQKIATLNKDHQQQISELRQKIKKGEGAHASTNNHSKDLEKLKKDLQNKEQMIKILGQSKENAKNQAKHQYEILKKQNNQLREELEQTKKSIKGGDGSDLELKVANEKLKRQFQQMKKMQKNMLVEKSSLKNQNQAMQLQLIKQKETIAKMLNMVQQESQELFTMITDCIA